jgi:hypothetical protein
MLEEEWATLDEFPNYSISTYGRVLTRSSERIKVPTQNLQNVPHVLLMRDRRQYRRSLPLLVATTFIPVPHDHFDTPINLNGDRMDNNIENLVWRPRWFAIKYNQQFRPGYIPAYTKPIENAETHEWFADTLAAATKYGLLDTEIWLAILNRTYVFPTNQIYQMIDW